MINLFSLEEKNERCKIKNYVLYSGELQTDTISDDTYVFSHGFDVFSDNFDVFSDDCDVFSYNSNVFSYNFDVFSENLTCFLMILTFFLLVLTYLGVQPVREVSDHHRPHQPDPFRSGKLEKNNNKSGSG